MSWSIEFLPEAAHDLDHLDNSVKKQVLKGIKKVSQNPLPNSRGGYGKPLGSHSGLNLTGLLKIKFADIGIRVVYQLIEDENMMKIIVILARSDEKVYHEALKRRKKYDN